MKPKYKVGDKVRIVKRTRRAADYRFDFIDEMAKLEGRFYKISHVGRYHLDRAPAPDDGYRYSLEGSKFNWASSMLELASTSKEESKVLDFTPKKKHYQLNFSV